MLLREFYETDDLSWQDEAEDHSAPKYGELRKTRLLLKEINKLRRMKEIQSFERANDLKRIRKQYKTPASEAGAVGF